MRQPPNGVACRGTNITNITGNDFNIYYDPDDDAALDDLTYDLEGGGELIPIAPSSSVPEPASLPLFASALGVFGIVRRRIRPRG